MMNWVAGTALLGAVVWGWVAKKKTTAPAVTPVAVAHPINYLEPFARSLYGLRQLAHRVTVTDEPRNTAGFTFYDHTGTVIHRVVIDGEDRDPTVDALAKVLSPVPVVVDGAARDGDGASEHA